MKRVKIFGFILLGIFVLIVASTLIGRENHDDVKFAKVERRYFEVSIEGKGEIMASKSINIYPPKLFFDNSLRIHQIKIDDLVKEGTKVKKGDYIAELDHTEILQRITNLEENIEQKTKALEVELLDSSVNLAGVRVQIQKTRDNLEDAIIRVEQSTYESPAIQRQAKIALDRIQRQLENSYRNYERRKIYEKNGIDRLKRKIADKEKDKSKLIQFNSELKIYAPEDGIIIYAQSRRRKVKAGDMVSPYYRSVIATLPDLNNLNSEVFINEIEITRISVGQEVKITADAIPDYEFKGFVKEISSIGKNSNEDDFKVYRVLVSIVDPANKLKPAMSSNNTFVLDTISNALTIPLNAVFGEDNHNFVYLRSGISIVKQEIHLGIPNKLDVVVTQGLDENDRILLNEPENAQDIKKIYLNTDKS